ncbi:hypothetical protein GCM10010329_10000 [Streptomyces spiroverticillatus]|nr:hypothetical protein GCM10010329_10000 [Streptomyces spiroverticillatus]
MGGAAGAGTLKGLDGRCRRAPAGFVITFSMRPPEARCHARIPPGTPARSVARPPSAPRPVPRQASQGQFADRPDSRRGTILKAASVSPPKVWRPGAPDGA